MFWFFLSEIATCNMHEPILHKQGSCSLQLNYRKASDSCQPVCCAPKWSFPLAGVALIDVGEALRELAEVKDALDIEVKQNFIDPLQNLHEKDLKEIQVGQSGPPCCEEASQRVLAEELTYVVLVSQHHLKKMEGRRLDFDYKKKRQGKVTDDEIKQALEKFDDSKEIAEQSMFNLLESDVSAT